jgi:hypothetical protein
MIHVAVSAPGPEPDPRLVIAYEESVRAWALQSSVLDELRTRAGVLLSGASISSAFLGAKSLEGGHSLSGFSIAATVVYAIVVLLCVYIAWPATFEFVHNGEDLIEEYLKDGVSPDQMRRSLTIANARHRVTNRAKIDHRLLGFRLASLGLGADVMLWLIELGTR